jgi:hypothetical protein
MKRLKLRNLKMVALATMLFLGSAASASNVVSVIRKSTGEISSFELEDSGKLYFSDDDLMIQISETSSPKSISLSDIAKVTFKEGTGVDDILSDGQSVYPNPTSDYVYISYVKEGAEVNVYAWNGMLLKTDAYSQQDGVSLVEMPVGMYVIRVDGRTFKVVKK